MVIEHVDMITRFVVATVVGLLIGLARKHMPAGIRTFSLICLGSTIFTVLSTSGTYYAMDEGRVIAQIVAGIGFLGLGVIWKGGEGKPTGLTTAAAIWVTAALGVLIGLAMWLEAAVGLVLVLITLISKKALTRSGLEAE